MLRHLIKAYRYKTKKERDESTDKRATKDIVCQVETYYMSATPEQPKKGRRMVKFRFHNGHWYHLPARTFISFMSRLDFEVTDKR